MVSGLYVYRCLSDVLHCLAWRCECHCFAVRGASTYYDVDVVVPVHPVEPDGVASFTQASCVRLSFVRVLLRSYLHSLFVFVSVCLCGGMPAVACAPMSVQHGMAFSRNSRRSPNRRPSLAKYSPTSANSLMYMLRSPFSSCHSIACWRAASFCF